MPHVKMTIFKEIIWFGASMNDFCMPEFNTVTVMKVESKKINKPIDADESQTCFCNW